MSQLKENLLYVKSLLVSMDNLNREEQQLQAQMKPLLPERKIELKKVNRSVIWGILTVIFIFSVLMETLLGAGKQVENVQIEYDNAIFNDTMRWYDEHGEDPYPGYTGDLKPITFTEGLVRALPLAIIGSVIRGVFWGIVLFSIQKLRNKYVEKENVRREERLQQIILQNHDIIVYNQNLQSKIEALHQRKALISQEYREHVMKWYPKDYGYISAVDYFINLVENHLANTIQEAVEQYKTYLYRQDMSNKQQQLVNKQQELVRQQMIGNFLNVANLATNISTNMKMGEVANNTSRMASSSERMANDVHNALH